MYTNEIQISKFSHIMHNGDIVFSMIKINLKNFFIPNN